MVFRYGGQKVSRVLPRWWLWVVFAHALGLMSSFDAMMSTRTAPGAVAWIVSLNAVPYAAVPAYWVFGRTRFQGYVLSRRDDDTMLAEKLSSKLAELHSRRYSRDPSDRHLSGIEKLAKLPILAGNHVQLLVDGEEAFGSIFAGIDAAKRYVLVQSYIIVSDMIGLKLQEALTRKVAEGVEVYLLYDEIGSYELSAQYLDHLRAAGVKVHHFHSNRGPGNRFQLNFRNHRKIVVVDGQYGWVGGFNMGEEYLNGHPSLGHWRDTHMALEGPAALALQLVFAEDWHWATEEVLDLPWYPSAHSGHAAPVLILPSGPADRFETASLMIQQAIHSAHQRIWISSPYFVPDEGVQTMLKLAALNGVDVRVLIPERPDNVLTYWAAYAFLGTLLEAGVKVYRYQDGFLHGKTFLVDNSMAAVGTVNLDNRSFRLNFEVTALVLDEAFANAVEAMFEEDFTRSRAMHLDELNQLSFWHKARSRAAYLFAPVL
ncbi:cardiolipin synthase [Nitrincola tapanii]|nr:cardiolipin synthase [Nitrincola tapanii]